MAKEKEVPYNDNQIAIAYYRYSSSGQDTSVEQQRELAQAYAKDHGYSLTEDHEYADPGISGTTSNRPQYNRMLSEVKLIKPAILILWKTDRLARNTYDIAFAKKTIREAGCRIIYLAEKTPDGTPEDALMEGFLDNMAAYYSAQLSVNIQRGQTFNANKGLYLGKKIFGYTTEGEGRHNKRYIIDPQTGPVLQRIFKMYTDGKKSMAQIAEILNAEGWRTVNGNIFDTNKIRKIIKNDEYLGIYRAKGIVKDDGTALPALITQDIYDKAQKMLEHNKKYGAQNVKGVKIDGTPRFWLTGKLFCGECSDTEHNEPMQGTSGHSHTGAIYYYYSCNDQHKGKKGSGCKKKPVRKEELENLICFHLSNYLKDSENLASLAVDIADYYKKEYDDHGYLEGLKNELKDVEKSLNNVIKAIMAGAAGETINNELSKLEERKKGLKEAVEIEEAKKYAVKDKQTIESYFQRFKKADMNDPQNRDLILNYFVDKIYLYDDRLVIIGKYEEDSGGTEYMLGPSLKSKDKKVRPHRTSLHGSP